MDSSYAATAARVAVFDLDTKWAGTLTQPAWTIGYTAGSTYTTLATVTCPCPSNGGSVNRTAMLAHILGQVPLHLLLKFTRQI